MAEHANQNGKNVFVDELLAIILSRLAVKARRDERCSSSGRLLTGLAAVDKRGLERGKLHLILGEERMGKTGLAISIADGLLRQGVPCGWVEVGGPGSGKKTVRRFLAAKGGLQERVFWRETLSRWEFTQLKTAAGELLGAPLVISEAGTEIDSAAQVATDLIGESSAPQVLVVDGILSGVAQLDSVLPQLVELAEERNTALVLTCRATAEEAGRIWVSTEGEVRVWRIRKLADDYGPEDGLVPVCLECVENGHAEISATVNRNANLCFVVEFGTFRDKATA